MHHRTIANDNRQHKQQPGTFAELHRKRSEFEATNSTLKGPHGLGKLRVRSKPHVAVAVLLRSRALSA